MTILVLRLFHIVFMAAWFGSAFFIAGDVRRTLSAPDANMKLLADRIRRHGRIAAAAGALTILTGFGLIFALGGFGSVPVAIHISITTAVVAWVVGGAVIGRHGAKIVAGLEGGAEPSSLLGHAKKIAMGVGIFHSLWLITLIMMVFRAQF